MKIYDVVWGNIEIKDPVAVKIIKHPAFQRIKNIWISAYGYLFELKRNSTRYEHCIGVYLLLHNFKASKDEQIAGLIHDVSHTALSHVSTYAFLGKYTGKEFHELQHQKFITDSGLELLLKKSGFDSGYISDEKNFPLLENDLPDICADRLDYTLRDGIHLQVLSRQDIQFILKHLSIHNEEFIFTDEQAAFTYAFCFYLLNKVHYGAATEAHFNNDFGNLVKFAVKKGILEEKDWFTDDIFLINKLKKSKNKKIQQWFAKYNNKMVVYEDIKNPQNVYPKKIRVVDPKVLINGKIRRLSEISEVYKKILNDYKTNHLEHELKIRVEYKK